MRRTLVWMVFCVACGAPAAQDAREPGEPSAPTVVAAPSCAHDERAAFACMFEGAGNGVALCLAGEGGAARAVARIRGPGESAGECEQSTDADTCSFHRYSLVQPGFGTRDGVRFTVGERRYFVYDEDVEGDSARGVRRAAPEPSQDWRCAGEPSGDRALLEAFGASTSQEYPY